MSRFQNRLNRLHLKIANTPLLRRILLLTTKLQILPFEKDEITKKKNDPKNLRNFEKKVFSQNGEDGIIQEIFKRIGTQNQYFVEFGVENGQECNSRFLLEKMGWKGLWIDGSEANVKKARAQFEKFPLKVDCHFITADNIQGIFSAHHVPEDLDLLSIDIDGNDFWILKKLESYRPRLLVVEYNASYHPTIEWVMPYNPEHRFDGTSYFGASLLSFTEFMKKRNYTLVACDSNGVNAFFVRNDLLKGLFSHTEGGAEYHYCAPKYRKNFFGHPPRVF